MAIKIQDTTVIDDSRNLTVNELTSVGPLTTSGSTLYTANTTPTYTSSTNTHTIDCSTGNYFAITINSIPPQIVSTSFIEHTTASSSVYSLPSGIQAGDRIYVYVFTTAFSVPAVTGYTAGGLNYSGSSGMALYAATAVDPVPTTFTIGANTGSGNFLVVVIYRSITINLARSAVNGSTGMADPPSVSITTPQQYGISIILGYMSTVRVATVTAPSGYTMLGSLQGVTMTGTVMAAVNSTPLLTGTRDPAAFGGTGSGTWYAVQQVLSTSSTYNPVLSFTNIPATNNMYNCMLKITNNSSTNLVYPIGTIFDQSVASIPSSGTTGYQVINTHNNGTTWRVSKLSGM